jgi:hypothetical protein
MWYKCYPVHSIYRETIATTSVEHYLQTLYALLFVPKEDKTMITTIAVIIAFVIISYCCYLVESTFSDLQHALSVLEVDSNNEQ